MINICLVCEEPANGKHFGAITCRACAAFFRRVAPKPQAIRPCKFKNRCKLFKKGCFTCKFCRLQKCFKVGMSMEAFQFDRDAYKVREMVQLDRRIPMTLDTFTGNSNLIIFSSNSQDFPRSFIDLRFLIDQAHLVFQQGPSTPLYAENRLKKMSLGLVSPQNVPETSENTKFGQKEAVEQLESQILSVSKWLTHFDEFQKLPKSLQIKILEGTWSVWSRLENLSKTSRQIRHNFDENVLKRMKNDTVLIEFGSPEMDITWLSKYTVEELKFFLNIPTEIRLDPLLRSMINLNPSEVELSFMLSQLCFHYVGKRFQGEILNISEKFQEILADDLHDYYVNEMNKSNYGSRMAQMMRINNQIQKEVYKHREKMDLARIFEVFCVDVSHPDLFLL
ncbi:hypothetical protein L5515_009471 [Caenorhabditis briggsae]|uniref:Nuclear Hormone Receptor family n=1 Tax=Caenorhabditis briggsae TaxID=6238 RepID=A0AAE9JMA6_CAEBR|nr:hypothetical protein L5515_009471 [Caenorhabditis briggsae]